MILEGKGFLKTCGENATQGSSAHSGTNGDLVTGKAQVSTKVKEKGTKRLVKR